MIHAVPTGWRVIFGHPFPGRNGFHRICCRRRWMKIAPGFILTPSRKDRVQGTCCRRQWMKIAPCYILTPSRKDRVPRTCRCRQRMKIAPGETLAPAHKDRVPGTCCRRQWMKIAPCKTLAPAHKGRAPRICCRRQRMKIAPGETRGKRHPEMRAVPEGRREKRLGEVYVRMLRLQVFFGAILNSTGWDASTVCVGMSHAVPTGRRGIFCIVTPGFTLTPAHKDYASGTCCRRQGMKIAPGETRGMPCPQIPHCSLRENGGR